MKKDRNDKTSRNAQTDDVHIHGEDQRIVELEAQIEELKAQLLRERADAMNVRRRAEEERLKLGSFYKALVIKEVLPAIDNFERALKAAGASRTSQDDLYKGIDSIYKQFVAALEKLGVEKIKTVGELFDPELHEAVTMDDGDGDQEIVSEELQSGYKIGDEVIRHAMVRVVLS